MANGRILLSSHAVILTYKPLVMFKRNLPLHIQAILQVVSLRVLDFKS